MPVTPYAAGTGRKGCAVAAHGGISLDLTRMDDVVDVRPEDRQIDVQTGSLREGRWLLTGIVTEG